MEETLTVSTRLVSKLPLKIDKIRVLQGIRVLQTAYYMLLIIKWSYL